MEPSIGLENFEVLENLVLHDLVLIKFRSARILDYSKNHKTEKHEYLGKYKNLSNF
jgi:hypothetical protein